MLCCVSEREGKGKKEREEERDDNNNNKKQAVFDQKHALQLQ